MTEPLRLLHFADLHIGMENYGRLDPSTGTSSRVRDFLDRLDELIDYGLENEADLVIFAGDAFKNRDPEPTQQREFARRIKRLAATIPTLLLVGNHDMPGMAAKANSLDIFRALDVPGVIVGHKPEARVVETGHGPVYLAWMPYPMRNRLLGREEYQGKTIQELEADLRTIVAEKLDEMAQDAAQHDMPRVLAGHFSVAEAEYGSERSVMLGRDVAVFRSVLDDPNWDYVALGHIHKHQSLNGKGHPPIVYSGSLERIDFGEEKDPKGFCWVRLARGHSEWSFIQLPARPFQTVRIDVRTAQNPTAAVLEAIDPEALAGRVVRLQIVLRAEQSAALFERDLQNALKECASLIIVRDLEQDVRTRLADLAPEALTPLELLERYFEARAEQPERIQRLLEVAEALLDDPD